jgi:hypothetical protein
VRASRCPGGSSKRQSLEYKSRELLLHQPVRRSRDLTSGAVLASTFSDSGEPWKNSMKLFGNLCSFVHAFFFSFFLKLYYSPLFPAPNSRIGMTAWRIPYARNLEFIDRSRYVFFQVASQLYSRGWVDPVPDLLLRKSGSSRNRTRTSGSVARNSDH